MRRFSVLILFGVSFLIMFAAFDYYFSRHEWAKYYRKEFAHHTAQLADEMILAKSLLESRQNMDELAALLESRRRVGAVNFWAVLHEDQYYRTSILDNERANFVFYLDTPGELRMPAIVEGQSLDHAYITENLSDGFQLVIGLRYSEEVFVDMQQKDSLAFIFKYLASVVVMAVLIFAYFFRDIMAAIRGLTSQGRSFRQIKTHSREGELLRRGFSAYEDHATRLERERELLKWQVLPSLRTELMSGKKPPYDFNCTLVRTDINNFSKIYNEYSIDEFTITINEFFGEVSHIISRYGGLVHEFIGDEVIYYFKDEDVGNSVVKALFAIRDINEAAAKISKMTLENRGYPFTVKSSLAHGKIRFARFVNGFNLAGSVLIETVRILSQVVEKDGNVVVFDERHLPWCGEVVQTNDYGSFKLKGFTHEKRLVSYAGHRSLKEFFERADFEGLQYYRSDKDITALIHQARVLVRGGDYLASQKIIGLLRHVTVTQSDRAPARELNDWLDEMLCDEGLPYGENEKNSRYSISQRSDERLVKTLASAIRLLENVVPKVEFTLEVDRILQLATRVNDRRIISNALDAQTYFKSDGDPRFSTQLARHSDNRVAANAIVHEGLRGLSPFVVRRLKKMMSSRRATHMASALYALGELASYHKHRDVIYYSTQLDFLSLIQSLPESLKHADAMVRRQALIAARKSDEAEVIAQVWSYIKSSKSESLLLEATEYLGDPPEQTSDAHDDAA